MRFSQSATGAYVELVGTRRYGSISHCYIIISFFFEFKNLVSVEDASSAPLQGENKYPRMLMVLGQMENKFDGA